MNDMGSLLLMIRVDELLLQESLLRLRHLRSLLLVQLVSLPLQMRGLVIVRVR
jgi:hypothetical protein